MAVDDPVVLPTAPPSLSHGGALTRYGRWAALAAALLGWLFDGLEMGLFPVVARPALLDLQIAEKDVTHWFGVITAGFLVGAATGGVLFGWIGDRLGRVRAMTLSVLTYAIFSGLCGLATSAWQIAVLRFIAALGMGGEWSLGVALIMEIWPNSSRSILAGLIGAAANLGYMLVAVVGIFLNRVLGDSWRLLLLLGTTPAILAFFIRLMVPESSRWEEERKQGGTSNWAARDLIAVAGGAVAALAIVALWAKELPWQLQTTGTLAALVAVTAGYLYPALRYLQRTDPADMASGIFRSPTVQRMLLAACLSAVPLLATWGSIQNAPNWADELTNPKGALVNDPEPKYYSQFFSALGACFGALLGGLLAGWLGRRLTYFVLCLASLAATLVFFQINLRVDALFLTTIFLAGAMSASFYGWLPLYLPELFRTGTRATGQGFGFNFGRVLAAIGVLQLGNLKALFGIGTPVASSVLCCVYILGLGLIWLAPETKGRPLPE